ncbi:Na/Pi cotransporter family protein [Alterileibacterium massiliense]|uniref:Na/Pi cotransporter family protein n=1 Tax=Alterileibacterium massiliense TaxID=1870997 RepID=UPI0008DAE9DE|nr:Na/Pi cotransporter family protein [Alterileibacterium massiliense]
MGVVGIASLLGGVALFLFGMSVMGDSLKKVAGNKLEVILYKLSGTPVKGILLGTGVTAVIQSSSATSVMVVGFVNSGMMKVDQAIGIIMGAILGTSVTGWILCLNSINGQSSSIASILSTQMITSFVAVIGIILRTFMKGQQVKNIGEILLGFAILMYGMSAMSSAVSPLRESAEFISILTKFSDPFIGIIAGLILTSIIQSSSAAVGILQALAVTGAVNFDIAFPLIMGIGIGASVPVLLSSIGASVNGKRTAWIYLIIDVLGALICGTVFYILSSLSIINVTDISMTMVMIALTNTIYRLIMVVILSPFIKILEKLVCKIFKDDETAIMDQEDMDRLETRFLNYPAIAIEQTHLTITSMAQKAKMSIYEAISLRRDFSQKKLKRINEIEDSVDRYEDKLGNYLMKITAIELNDAQTREVSKYLHSLSDFERISDHAENVGEAGEEIYTKKIIFSDKANEELMTLESALKEILSISIEAFINNDIDLAVQVEPLEELIDNICDEMKFRHIERLKNKECTLVNGFVFNDLLTNYERIADHCSNIALVVIEEKEHDLNSHEYIDAIRNKNDARFIKMYEQYKEKYAI